MSADITEALTVIAKAAASLYDDAYNPVQGATVAPIEPNRWNADALLANRHSTTHPHLRHPVGYKNAGTPAGDRTAAWLYEQTCRAVQAASVALRATQTDVRGRERIPNPTDLVSMCAAILRSTPDQLTTVVEYHAHQLARTAHSISGWTQTTTPPLNNPVCADPFSYRRCKGLPVVANDMCRACYDRQRYLDRRSA